MKTVNDSEQRSLLCSLLANRIQRLGSPEYPDGDDNPSESPLSVLAYRTDTSCLTQRGRSGDASRQAGPRNNSGLSITHSDDSTEWSFFVQPQVRSVRRRLEVESHANHCEPLNPNVGKYSRELGTGAVLDGVLDPGLRCFLLAVRFEHSVPCRILAQQQLIDITVRPLGGPRSDGQAYRTFRFTTYGTFLYSLEWYRSRRCCAACEAGHNPGN